MAQAAPLAGLHCPMVAVPRSPRAAARKLRLLSARTALKQRASRRFERGQAPAASICVQICVSGAKAGAFAVALRAECQRARRIRAQQLTRMRVNARKSSYGMKQSINRAINLQERKNNSWHPSAETNEFEPMPLAESNTTCISINWFRQMRLRRYCHHRCDDQYLEV